MLLRICAWNVPLASFLATVTGVVSDFIVGGAGDREEAGVPEEAFARNDMSWSARDVGLAAGFEAADDAGGCEESPSSSDIHEPSPLPQTPMRDSLLLSLCMRYSCSNWNDVGIF